jgi:hypothetical protein
VGLKDKPQVLYIFFKLINRIKYQGRGILVPNLFRVKNSCFSQKWPFFTFSGEQLVLCTLKKWEPSLLLLISSKTLGVYLLNPPRHHSHFDFRYLATHISQIMWECTGTDRDLGHIADTDGTSFGGIGNRLANCKDSLKLLFWKQFCSCSPVCAC